MAENGNRPLITDSQLPGRTVGGTYKTCRGTVRKDQVDNQGNFRINNMTFFSWAWTIFGVSAIPDAPECPKVCHWLDTCLLSIKRVNYHSRTCKTHQTRPYAGLLYHPCTYPVLSPVTSHHITPRDVRWLWATLPYKCDFSFKKRSIVLVESIG